MLVLCIRERCVPSSSSSGSITPTVQDPDDITSIGKDLSLPVLFNGKYNILEALPKYSSASPKQKDSLTNRILAAAF